jgi:hypothetical protein
VGFCQGEATSLAAGKLSEVTSCIDCALPVQNLAARGTVSNNYLSPPRAAFTYHDHFCPPTLTFASTVLNFVSLSATSLSLSFPKSKAKHRNCWPEIVKLHPTLTGFRYSTRFLVLDCSIRTDDHLEDFSLVVKPGLFVHTNLYLSAAELATF